MQNLVLWDIDGTLLASKPGIGDLTTREFIQAAQTATGHGDIRPPDRVHGSTDFAIMREVFHNSGFTQQAADAHLFGAFAALHTQTTSPSYIDKTRRAVPGAQEALRSLPGIHTYGTGNLPGRAQAKTAFFSMDQYLDPQIGGFGFWTARRSDFLRHAHQLAQRKYEEDLRGIVVGDTPADIEGAREAGFDVIAVAGGHYTEAELSDADLVVSDYQDLGEIERFLS